MSSFITFIDEDYLKSTSPMDLNIDTKNIVPTIIYAQEMQILPLLGTGLYNEIKTQIDTDSVSSTNSILLTAYTKMALAQWVLYESLPFLQFKITNKAIEKKTGENSEVVSLSELNYLRDKILNQAQFYSERTTQYLIANSSLYPLYSNPGASSDTISPKTKNYSTGLYIPNRNSPKYFGNGNT